MLEINNLGKFGKGEIIQFSMNDKFLGYLYGDKLKLNNKDKRTEAEIDAINSYLAERELFRDED